MHSTRNSPDIRCEISVARPAPNLLVSPKSEAHRIDIHSSGTRDVVASTNASCLKTLKKLNSVASQYSCPPRFAFSPCQNGMGAMSARLCASGSTRYSNRSEEHTSELQSRLHLVCR